MRELIELLNFELEFKFFKNLKGYLRTNIL